MANKLFLYSFYTLEYKSLLFNNSLMKQKTTNPIYRHTNMHTRISFILKAYYS